jgi:serine/threonine-protein kinase
MAPEQMLGGRVDRRADVYSMGVLLWEAATGQRMWKGMSDIQVMNRVANEGGQPLSEIGAAVDPELAAIVRKALDDDPERRFATARELAAAIEPLIEGTGTGTGTTNRALGVLMRELFDDVRQQARVLIESQLQEVRTDGADPAFIPPDIVQLSPRAQGSGELPMSSSRSNVGTTNSSKPRPSLKREVVLFSVMGAAIVGMVALLAVRRDSRGDDASAASALAPSAAAGLSPADPSASGAPAAEPPEAKTVSLEITSNPPSAIVFLDGRRLPVNPYSGSLPQDGATHEVRVEATGFETRTLKLTADRDTHLVVALDAAPSPRAALPTKPAPSARSAPSASAAPAIDKNCTPPFVIDAAGIKKFKPECL